MEVMVGPVGFVEPWWAAEPASHAEALAGAPTLTSPTGAALGSTGASGTVSTDQGNGTLYWIVDQSALSPSVAQIQAGNDQGGLAADDSGNQTVTATGSQAIIASGLTAGTTYYIYYQHNSAGGDSTVVGSSSFTTPSTDPDATENISIAIAVGIGF